MAEKVCIWLAWIAPRRFVYWCAIRVMAHAASDQYPQQVVPELLAMDALKRWEVRG